MATQNIPTYLRRTFTNPNRHILIRLYATAAAALTTTEINHKTSLIDRWNPDPPTEPTPQTYKIDLNECSPMVLDALIKIKNKFDPTLTFRRSCREGTCGSCAMNIDGCNGLACLTKIPELKVTEPTMISSAVKDLVEDMTIFDNQYKSVPWLKGKNPAPEEGKEYFQSKERKKLDGKCASCSTSWPSYLGPTALLHAHRNCMIFGRHTIAALRASSDAATTAKLTSPYRLLISHSRLQGSFFLRGVHGVPPAGTDPFPLEIKPGLQKPEWTDGYLSLEIKKDMSVVDREVVIHCDASVETVFDGWFVVIGIVARDCKSKELLWYGSLRFRHYSGNPTEAEMLAILLAAYTGRCMGLKTFYVRNDNPQAVDLVNRDRDRVDNKFLPIYDALQKLKEGPTPHISWIKHRKEREAAHHLSRAERGVGDERDDCLRRFKTCIRLDYQACRPQLTRELTFSGRDFRR